MSANPISANSVGIGLRAEHYQDATCGLPPVDWFEVHSENYFGQGGQPHFYLSKIRTNYSLSFHGVGLSLGSTDPLDFIHLKRLKELIDQYQPALVSEHLSWSSIHGTFLHDLLPLPMTEEVVQHLVNRISQVQNYLGRQILIENASTYLEFSHSQMSEWEFITQIALRSGCGILLDINNVYVNACNHHFNAMSFINAIPADLVGEIHLAGHTLKELDEGKIRIDTHDQRVCDEVWQLYKYTQGKLSHVPTLIEWDKNLPPFSVLLEEAALAKNYKQAQVTQSAAA